MGSQNVEVKGFGVLTGDDSVGIYVITVHVGFAYECLVQRASFLIASLGRFDPLKLRRPRSLEMRERRTHLGCPFGRENFDCPLR